MAGPFFLLWPSAFFPWRLLSIFGCTGFFSTRLAWPLLSAAFFAGLAGCWAATSSIASVAVALSSPSSAVINVWAMTASAESRTFLPWSGANDAAPASRTDHVVALAGEQVSSSVPGSPSGPRGWLSPTAQTQALSACLSPSASVSAWGWMTS